MNRMRRLARVAWGCLILLASGSLAGCGRSSSVPGGTSGRLFTDGNPIPDVQIRVYEAGSDAPIGYGITGTDGSFQLVTADSRGPLHLPPGNYVVTLESVGAPTDIPDTYRQVTTSPFKIAWSGDGAIELNVPGLKLNPR